MIHIDPSDFKQNEYVPHRFHGFDLVASLGKFLQKLVAYPLLEDS